MRTSSRLARGKAEPHLLDRAAHRHLHYRAPSALHRPLRETLISRGQLLVQAEGGNGLPTSASTSQVLGARFISLHAAGGVCSRCHHCRYPAAAGRLPEVISFFAAPAHASVIGQKYRHVAATWTLFPRSSRRSPSHQETSALSTKVDFGTVLRTTKTIQALERKSIEPKDWSARCCMHMHHEESVPREKQTADACLSSTTLLQSDASAFHNCQPLNITKSQNALMIETLTTSSTIDYISQQPPQ